MYEIIRTISEYFIIWVISFIIILAQLEDIKLAAKATAMFLILLYLFFGYLFLIVYMGGHLTI